MKDDELLRLIEEVERNYSTDSAGDIDLTDGLESVFGISDNMEIETSEEDSEEISEEVSAFKTDRFEETEELKILGNRGTDAFFKRDYKNAIKFYRKYLKAKPRSGITWNLIGIAYRQQKDFENALEAFRNEKDLAEEKGEEHVSDYYYHIGLTYYNMSDINMAIYYMEKQVEVNPDKKSGIKLSNFYIEKEDYEKGIEILSNLSKKYPEDIEIENGIIKGYYGLNDFDNAMGLVEKVLKWNDSATKHTKETYRLGAGILKRQKETEKLIQFLEEARDKFPKDPNFHYKLGEALIDKKYFGYAVKELKKAKSLADFDTNIDIRLADAFRLKGNIEAAKKIYDSFLEEHPESQTFHYVYGIFASRIGEYETAISHLEHADELDEDKVFVVTGGINDIPNKLVALYIKTGQIDGLDSVFRRIIDYDPDDYNSNVSMGYNLATYSSDSERIIGYFRRAIEINPDEALPHSLLARVYAKIEDVESAREEFDILKKIKPDGDYDDLAKKIEELEENA